MDSAFSPKASRTFRNLRTAVHSLQDNTSQRTLAARACVSSALFVDEYPGEPREFDDGRTPTVTGGATFHPFKLTRWRHAGAGKSTSDNVERKKKEIEKKSTRPRIAVSPSSRTFFPSRPAALERPARPRKEALGVRVAYCVTSCSVCRGVASIIRPLTGHPSRISVSRAFPAPRPARRDVDRAFPHFNGALVHKHPPCVQPCTRVASRRTISVPPLPSRFSRH